MKRVHKNNRTRWELVVVAWLCGIGPLTLHAQTTATSPADDRDALALMTFNIRYGTASDGENHWDKRRDLLIGVIREHRPDVLGLQEALRFQIDAIRRALPEYKEIGVGRDNGKQAGEYSAILFRSSRLQAEQQGTFWLSDTPEVPGSRSWGNGIPRICTWARFRDALSSKRFHVYNVHMDHESQPSRERGAELIARRMLQRSPAGPIILMGDFNAKTDNPAVRYLLGQVPRAHEQSQDVPAPPPLLDTCEKMHDDQGNAGTFHAFRGNLDGPRIDYIFVSPQFVILSSAILRDHIEKRYPSDHFPVLARVRLGP